MLDEALIVAERKNADLANLAILVQAAIHTFPATDGKEAFAQANKNARAFGKMIGEMIGDR